MFSRVKNIKNLINGRSEEQINEELKEIYKNI